MSFSEIGMCKGPGAETFLATQKGQGGNYEGDWLSARPEGQLDVLSSGRASQAGEEPDCSQLDGKLRMKLTRVGHA